MTARRQGRGWIARRLWDVDRFGLSPAGAWMRLRPPPEAPRVVSISMPKAGTHLVERALCLHPLLHRRLTRTVFANQPRRLASLLARLRRGEVVCAHMRYDSGLIAEAEASRATTLFVIRDPRDVVVSKAHYSFVSGKHRSHDVASRLPRLEDRLALFIEGDSSLGVPSIGTVLAAYAGYLEDDRCRIVRYEDLIDPATRLPQLAALYADLEIPIGGAELERIAADLVSPVSVTFRRGGSGEWREAFDDDLLKAFQRVAGGLMGRFGYE